MNVTSLFLLSNVISNLEKISFLPRINGLFSLLENAQVMSTGVLVILTVILARYATTLFPSIPQKCIWGRTERLIPRSRATDLGIIVQSAPVSTKKSNRWYPSLVKTAIGITGSGMVPNCVRFWFKGKLTRIDADGVFGGDKADNQIFSIDMLLGQFFRKLGIGFSMGNNFVVFSANIFAGIIFLQSRVRNIFHRRLLGKDYMVCVLRSQGVIQSLSTSKMKRRIT